ncbi:MAG: adenine nucleotide alpha hydrolase family protein [Anaerolineae bacterium]|nr:adenine nucleotide alpha hydrolase family protein [Anaerolineae bacterium]
MKCRKCSARAVINMRQHKLALCKTHFVTWMQEQTERSIHHYRMFTRDERVLVAVSGGKDSLALWDILLALGYRADGLYISLGIDEGTAYSEASYAYVRAFAARHPEAVLHTVDVAAVYGASIPEAAQVFHRGKPCSSCGLAKRHIMNRVAGDEGYPVLATGHNLDDEAATLLGNTLSWSVEYLRRQGPVLPPGEAGLVRKVKPLCRFYERETAAYALLRGIDYIYEECPFAADATSLRYKELLNALEQDSPGSKLRFYLNFLRAREQHPDFLPEEEGLTLRACPTCGQATTNNGDCTFCRMWDRVRMLKAQEAATTPA